MFSRPSPTPFISHLALHSSEFTALFLSLRELRSPHDHSPSRARLLTLLCALNADGIVCAWSAAKESLCPFDSFRHPVTGSSVDGNSRSAVGSDQPGDALRGGEAQRHRCRPRMRPSNCRGGRRSAIKIGHRARWRRPHAILHAVGLGRGAFGLAIRRRFEQGATSDRCFEFG